MKPGEVREKSTEELKKLSLQLEEDVFRLRFRKEAGQLKQTANIGKTRRDLARVKTVLNERAAKEKMEARRA